MGMTEEGSGADVVIMKSANEVLQLVRAINRLSKRSAAKQPAQAKSGLRLKQSAGS
jgi:hypothetical protein